MVVGVGHIRDLSQGLVGALKGCRSAGKAWGSLRCDWGSAFLGAATIENEDWASLEEM